MARLGVAAPMSGCVTLETTVSSHIILAKDGQGQNPANLCFLLSDAFMSHPDLEQIGIP